MVVEKSLQRTMTSSQSVPWLDFTSTRHCPKVPFPKIALRTDGIELIAPNRRNRRKTQDRRKLRRYKKRWRVERLFAWMHNLRRPVTRWEYHIENFLGFVQLACIHITLRRL
jgi:transposase